MGRFEIYRGTDYVFRVLNIFTESGIYNQRFDKGSGIVCPVNVGEIVTVSVDPEEPYINPYYYENSIYYSVEHRNDTIKSGDFSIPGGLSFVVPDVYDWTGDPLFVARIGGRIKPTKKIMMQLVGIDHLSISMNDDFYEGHDIYVYYYGGVSREDFDENGTEWIDVGGHVISIRDGKFPEDAKLIIKASSVEIMDFHDPNSFSIQFFPSEDSDTPAYEYNYNPNSDYEFTFDIDNPYIRIIGEQLDEQKISIHTIGLRTFKINYDGHSYSYWHGIDDVTSHSIMITTHVGSLVEIREAAAFAKYDQNSFKISFFKENESNSWYTGDFNVDYGSSFIVTKDHGRVTIRGDEKDPEPGERVTIHIRKGISISNAAIYIEESFRNLTGTDNVFYVYTGSDIIFDSIEMLPSFDVPYILRFYKSDEYNPDEITLTTRFVTGNIMPRYSVNGNTLYAEIAASVPEFLWYGSEQDDIKFIKRGNLFTENFSAEMWNNFRYKLSVVAALYGIIYGFYDVYPDDIFYGMGIPGYPRYDFSDVLDVIQLLPGSSMTIGHKGTGATVYASYFQNSGDPAIDFHGNSIKKALNDVIHHYNGET